MAQEPGKRAFFCLDGMRGVAALVVLSAHSSMLFTHTLRQFVLAVDFFFVLSGFVLAYAYSSRLLSGMPARDFIYARIVRIYPLYLVAILIGFAHAVMAPHSAEGGPLPALWGQLGLGLLLMPVSPLTAGHGLYPLDYPAWSLFFELLANVVFGLLWLRLYRSKPGLAALIAGSAMTLLGCGLVYDTFDLGAVSDHAWAGVPRVLFSFFLGVVLYELHRRRPATIQLNSWVLLAILPAAMALHFSNRTLDILYQYAMIVAGFPLLVYLGAASVPGARSARVFHLLGVTSYAVYVLHVPMFYALRDIGSYAGIDLAAYAPWTGALFAAGLIGLCVLIDRYYDVPVRRYFSRLGRTPAGPARAGA